MTEQYGVCSGKVLDTSFRRRNKRRCSANILFLALLTAVLLGWPSMVLKAAPQGINKSISSTATDEKAAQPAKPLNQHQLVPVTLHSPRFDPSSASPYRAVLDQYCVVCHNEQLRTAGLILDNKMDVANVSDGSAVWEKVVNKLRTRSMPPAGMPRPDNAMYDSFRAYLEAALDRAAEADPQPGRVAIHRLNRAEYTNAIRDLLAVDTNVESLLPIDDSGYGFDNIADVLSVSPMLLERYLSAAGKISRLAMGDPNIRPALDTYNLPELLMQNDRMSEDLPFGSRGGIAVRHNFPLDGEYAIKVRLARAPDDHILGLAETHQLEVRVDGASLKMFTVGGEHLDKSKIGSDVSLKDSNNKDPERDQYELTADAGLEIRFQAKAGRRLVAVYFLSETSEPEGAMQAQMSGFYAVRKIIYRGGAGGPAVARVTVSGPYDPKGLGETPSRRKIFACRPAGSTDELPCARKILSALARRAYRRPITDHDIEVLINLYEAGRKEGGFETGVGAALKGILISPKFLFRIEREPANIAPGTAYRISDLELASRLSFFLWSSIPDDQLLDLAAAGKLKDPAVLEQQVRRMLADSRSKALVTNFFGQWLYLRNMQRVTPNPVAFPDFDENLREAFEQETELFLESNLREDRSVLDLVNANYTFVNERLARFYGIPNIYGSHFRRVTLTGNERRGLLGEGSILTVTSYANRTSPTVRGKWLLENILGTPPAPPPANVPSLKEENSENGKVLTMRERMEEHRKNPACAGCHGGMDPLGFALENFDGIGEWRNSEANIPLDASGVLPDGTKFEGPAGLRNVLLSHPEQFATTVTEKLLTYALGRGVEYYDAPAIRKIAREAAGGDYRWSSLVLGIVKSTPFQMRTNKPQELGIVKTMVSQSQFK
jgi:hypothetical protein